MRLSLSFIELLSCLAQGHEVGAAGFGSLLQFCLVERSEVELLFSFATPPLEDDLVARFHLAKLLRVDDEDPALGAPVFRGAADGDFLSADLEDGQIAAKKWLGAVDSDFIRFAAIDGFQTRDCIWLALGKSGTDGENQHRGGRQGPGVHRSSTDFIDHERDPSQTSPPPGCLWGADAAMKIASPSSKGGPFITEKPGKRMADVACPFGYGAPMRTVAWILSLALGTTAPAVGPGGTRPSVDQVLDSISQLVEFRGVAISPDGASVAWVEAVRGKDGPLPERSIISVLARVGAHRRARRRRAAGLTRARGARVFRSPRGAQHA